MDQESEFMSHVHDWGNHYKELRMWMLPQSMDMIFSLSSPKPGAGPFPSSLIVGPALRLGDEERRLMNLVPAPAVRLMKRRVLSRPGLNSPLALVWMHRLFIPQVTIDPQMLSLSLWWVNK